jgi:hypothetical protein
MRQIQELQKQWQDRGRFSGLHAGMSLEREGLVLCAKTLLAKRGSDGALELEGSGARTLALLAVAYGRPVDDSVLGAIRRASKHAQAGDESLAAMHIALAGLPKLPDPADAARRLFIADGLLADGVTPRDIFAALEFDSAPLDELEKFNPNQPRVPAGSGRPSGQWTSGESSSAAEEPLSDAAERTVRQLLTEGTAQEVEAAATSAVQRLPQWLLNGATIAADFAGPFALLAGMLIPTPAGGKRQEGEVPGRPDLRYAWNEDETQLEITRESDGQVVLQATLGPDGKFRVRHSRAIARLLNEHVLIDPSALPPEDPRSSQRNDMPQQCPEPPKPDKEGGPRSIAYANHMKALINQPPTPPGFGYRLYNPFANGDPVNYDDCERDSGTLDEFKGPGYAGQLSDKNEYYGEEFEENLTLEWLDQATRQIEASGGRPVTWYFAEQPALDFAKKLFGKYPILMRIRTEYAPWREGETWK